MSEIHPLAVVHPGARVGRDVRIDAFSYVGADVELGDGCVLHPHVTLMGPARIGPGNTFYPQCVIGAAPQDLKYKGGPTSVEIGAQNIFRESVTIHRGTEVDRVSGGVTRVGSHNLLMVGVHVAHDCDLGDHIIIANNVQIAGHVRVEDCVTIGGASAMHHFVTLGRHAYIGGMTRVTHDAPPYLKVHGYDQDVRAVNTTSMERWRMPLESVRAMKRAFRLLYARKGGRTAGRTLEAMHEIENSGLIQDEHVRYLCEFLRRKMNIGVFGRVREHMRSDSDEDRAAFYSAKNPQETCV